MRRTLYGANVGTTCGFLRIVTETPKSERSRTAATRPQHEILSALIVLGAAIVLSGSTLSGIVPGFMPNTEEPRGNASCRERAWPRVAKQERTAVSMPPFLLFW